MSILLLLAAATAGAVQVPNVALQPAGSPFEITSVLDEVELDSATARQGISLTASAEQKAAVSSSSVSGTSTTGTVNMSDNAFQNLSGLSIVNANTGNNVAINAAMNVNVIFTPQP